MRDQRTLANAKSLRSTPTPASGITCRTAMLALFLPSLKGRGRGWVGTHRVPSYTRPMRRVPDHMTRYARAMRSDPTEAERLVWRRISRYRPRFTRQLVVGPYILDLACRTAKLAIEFDGSQHADAIAYDAARTAWLGEAGWTVMRVWNNDVIDNCDDVVEAILDRAAECLGGTHPQPLPEREGRKREA